MNRQEAAERVVWRRENHGVVVVVVGSGLVRVVWRRRKLVAVGVVERRKNPVVVVVVAAAVAGTRNTPAVPFVVVRIVVAVRDPCQSLPGRYAVVSGSVGCNTYLVLHKA